MITLGAYLIVKNEELVIRHCLNSLCGLDEIVILDTGSTDKTPDIIKEYHKIYNIKYYFNEYVWKDDFADARNNCLLRCNADYLIVIDADEVLIGEIDKIKNYVERTQKRAYNVKTVSKTGNSIHYSIRLHKRDKSIFWEKPIHNHLNILAEDTIDCMEIVYGYSPAHCLDPDRALRILTKYVEEHPECLRERFYLAREYYYMADYKKAIELYIDYINRSYMKKSIFIPEIVDAWLTVAKCATAEHNKELAIRACNEAISLNPDVKEAYYLLLKYADPKDKENIINKMNQCSNKNVLFIRCP